MRSNALAALVCACLLVSGAVHADTSESWVSARLALGLHGEVEIEGNESEVDLTRGGELLSHYRMHDYLALMAGFGVLSWKDEDAEGDRNTLIDLAVGPTLLAPISDQLVAYLAGRVGGTLSLIGEDEFFGGDVDPALGWHVGARAGARIAVSDTLGFEVDVGLTRHMATHEVDTVFGSSDVEGELTQLLLRLGLSWSVRP